MLYPFDYVQGQENKEMGTHRLFSNGPCRDIDTLEGQDDLTGIGAICGWVRRVSGLFDWVSFIFFGALHINIEEEEETQRSWVES